MGEEYRRYVLWTKRSSTSYIVPIELYFRILCDELDIEITSVRQCYDRTYKWTYKWVLIHSYSTMNSNERHRILLLLNRVLPMSRNCNTRGIDQGWTIPCSPERRAAASRRRGERNEMTSDKLVQHTNDLTILKWLIAGLETFSFFPPYVTNRLKFLELKRFFVRNKSLSLHHLLPGDDR